MSLLIFFLLNASTSTFLKVVSGVWLRIRYEIMGRDLFYTKQDFLAKLFHVLLYFILSTVKFSLG